VQFGHFPPKNPQKLSVTFRSACSGELAGQESTVEVVNLALYAGVNFKKQINFASPKSLTAS
jgi:hypothetical protein